MIYLWVSLGIVGGVALICAFVYFNNGVIGVTRYTQELGLEREVKIVHLSDLHGKAFGYKNARLIKKVAAEKPGRYNPQIQGKRQAGCGGARFRAVRDCPRNLRVRQPRNAGREIPLFEKGAYGRGRDRSGRLLGGNMRGYGNGT